MKKILPVYICIPISLYLTLYLGWPVLLKEGSIIKLQAINPTLLLRDHQIMFWSRGIYGDHICHLLSPAMFWILNYVQSIHILSNAGFKPALLGDRLPGPEGLFWLMQTQSWLFSLRTWLFSPITWLFPPQNLIVFPPNLIFFSTLLPF